MELRELIGPAALALTAMPVLLVAGLVRGGRLELVDGLDASRLRDPRGVARRLSLLLAAVGFAMVAGGAGLLWAGGDENRIVTVTSALLVVVNALAVALVLAVAKARRDEAPRDARHPDARR